MNEFSNALEQLAERISDWAELVLVMLAITAVSITSILVVSLFVTYNLIKTREATERLVELQEAPARRPDAEAVRA